MRQFFTILFLILNSVLFAQSNYQKGYLIKNNGDTVKGLVNVREWTLSPKYIEFKSSLEDKNSTKFYPQDIRGFNAGQEENYISYLGSISLNKVKTTEISNGLDTTKMIDTTFLKQIASGNNVNLYYQQDAIKIRYFISELKEKPQELQYFVSFNESNDPVNSPIYKGQLRIYLNKFKPGNERLINLINESSYDQNDFERIVNGLNNTIITSKSTKGYRFFVGIGLNSTTTDINKAVYTGLTPKFNFGIDLFENAKVQKFVLRGDFSFSYINYHYDNFQNVDGYYPEIYNTLNDQENYTLNQYTIAFTPKGIINIFNKERFKAYLGIGIGFNYAFYSNSKITFIDKYNSIAPVNNPYDYESYYSNFPIDAGIQINKKFEFNFTYILNSPFTKQLFFYAKNHVNGFSIKYFFGK